MQFKNQQAIDLLAKLHAGGFPSAIVAGGCVRDEIFGKPVKDIDVFVSYEDLSSWYTDDHEAHLSNAVDRDVMREDWSSYMPIPDIEGVFTIAHTPGELPMQIIVMAHGLSPVERIGLLDFGFCQAFYDGSEVVEYTWAFHDDLHHKTITLVHCENQHEFDRSMVRYERLKQKYPEFPLVIPQEYQQYHRLGGNMLDALLGNP